MKIKVLSLDQVQSPEIMRYIINKKKTIIVSVTDGEEANIPHSTYIKNILRLSFMDLDRVLPEDMQPKFILFGWRQAKAILDFVEESLDRYDIEQIVVHCAAGVSRSPAIAGALSYLLKGYDYEILEEHGCFNRRVYITLISEYLSGEFAYKRISKYFNDKRKCYRSPEPMSIEDLFSMKIPTKCPVCENKVVEQDILFNSVNWQQGATYIEVVDEGGGTTGYHVICHRCNHGVIPDK